MKPEHCSDCGTKMKHIKHKNGGKFICNNWNCNMKKHFTALKLAVQENLHSGHCTYDCAMCYPQFSIGDEIGVITLGGVLKN